MLMLKIFLGFTLIAVLPSIYLFFRLNIKRTSKGLQSYFWLLPVGISIGLVYLSFIASGKFINTNESALGWFILLYFALVIPRLILSLILLISTPLRKTYKGMTHPLIVVSFLVSVLMEGALIYGTFIGRNNFQLKEFTYASSEVPPGFDGYRIIQLSDLHVDSWKGNKRALEQFVKLCNKQEADLIVFTGDLVSYRTADLDGFDAILSKLTAKDGVYSVLGNHDYGEYYRYWQSYTESVESFYELLHRQENMGWTLLNNEHVFLYQQNDSIALIGVENEGEPPFSQYGDLKKAMKGTEGCFQILLSHNPSHWRREVLPDSEIDLMLAGHTHAMQLEIFHKSPASWVYPEWQGAYYYGNRALYVNIGAGEIGIPFRLGAWPEITLITLKHV